MIKKAKIIGILMGAQAVLIPGALAASVNLAWDPSPDQVAGYKVYISSGSQVVTNDVGNTTAASVSNLTAGQNYSFYVTAYDQNAIESDPSNTITYTPPNQTPSGFLASDSVTRGNWKGVYGADGVWVEGTTPALPAYATVSTSDATWTWAASTTNPNAPQTPTGSGRIAACWYSATALNYNIAVSDGQAHRLTMYFWDASNSGRQQRVDLIDPATGIVLDRQTLSGFANGIYLSWIVNGNVAVRVTSLNVNAVVSAIFFDPLSSTAAQFVGTDATTKGNWPGVYGSEGSVIPMDSTQRYPSYSTVTPTQYSQWAYSTDGTDIRAPKKNDNSGRIPGVWYSQYPSTNAFYVDVPMTDNATHRMAVYALDWYNQGRAVQIDVLNPATGQVLDTRQLTSIGGGNYLIWDVKGKIRLRVSTLTGPNAMISGVFFDPSPTQL